MQGGVRQGRDWNRGVGAGEEGRFPSSDGVRSRWRMQIIISLESGMNGGVKEW